MTHHNSLKHLEFIGLTSCNRMFVKRIKEATAKVPPNDHAIVGTIDRLISCGLLAFLDFLFLCCSQFSSHRGIIVLALSAGFRSYRSSALSGFFQPLYIIPSNQAKNILLIKVALTSGDIIPLSSRSKFQNFNLLLYKTK